LGYTWKCHNETTCVATLNKQKCLFFFFLFYKKGEQESKTGPVWEVGSSGNGEEIRKGCERENMVEIFCTHIYVNGKMRPVETIPGIGKANKGE
jgi:hypothetical protein